MGLVIVPVKPKSRYKAREAERSSRSQKKSGICVLDFEFEEASELERVSGVSRAARLTVFGVKIYV
jgi:hypothetical protein